MKTGYQKPKNTKKLFVYANMETSKAKLYKSHLYLYLSYFALETLS